MSKNKKLFSGAIGGFKKSQVVEYIEELNRKAKMTKEESDYEITRLENEISSLSGQLAELDDIKGNFEEAKEALEKLDATLSQVYGDLEETKLALSEKEKAFLDEKEKASALSASNADLSAELSELRAKCEKLESENKMLSDDVQNQRGIILASQNENEALLQKLALSESECARYKEKAEQYDADLLFAGGVCERAKTESSRILSETGEKAANLLTTAKLESDKIIAQANEEKARAIAESEAVLEENMKKIRYLYKRREDLLAAFRKVKDAAGGFYDNVANTLSESNE